jgi:hypothetical protein
MVIIINKTGSLQDPNSECLKLGSLQPPSLNKITQKIKEKTKNQNKTQQKPIINAKNF